MIRATGFSVVVRQLIRDRATVEVEDSDYVACEVQQKCAGAAAEALHHRRPRQRGGSRRSDTNMPSNSLATCARCHEFIESFRGLAVENGWLVHQGAKPSDVPVLRRGEWCQLDDLGGFELVRNVMCDNGKSPDEGVEWKDPAQRELPGDGRLTVERESTR